jgi:hypothetical protein
MMKMMRMIETFRTLAGDLSAPDAASIRLDTILINRSFRRCCCAEQRGDGHPASQANADCVP